ncbi:MAG: sugar phosphate isomerase/epimerase [Planctomycetia bacterium]|nr:sugar phosphate isomerase/epimerase [Planctomycetia bacterium]
MFKNLSPEALGIAASQSELIELALSFGFRGLDLDILDFAEQARTRGLAHARRFIESAKLQVGAFRLPTHWQADDGIFRGDLRRVPEWAAPAAEAGYRRAVTTIEPASDERPFHQNFELCRQRLNEVAAALAAHEIRLGIAFAAPADLRKGKSFEFIHDVDALLLLIGTIQAKNVGVALDLWDLHASGGSMDALKKIGGNRLVTIRVADAPADVPATECTSSQRLLPGETGVINAAAALVTLAELGYDGPITPAPHPEQLKGLRREAAVKRVGEKLDQIWKTAGLTTAGKLAPARR